MFYTRKPNSISPVLVLLHPKYTRAPFVGTRLDADNLRLKPILGVRDGYQEFPASRGISAEAIIDKEQEILRVRGFLVGLVSVVGNAIRHDFQHIVAMVLQWYSLMLSYDSNSHDKAFIRTLTCDRYKENSTYSFISRLLRNVLGVVSQSAHRLFPRRHMRLMSGARLRWEL